MSQIIVIEGNIGAGKTTLLNFLKSSDGLTKLLPDAKILPYEERVADYERFGPITLAQYYANPSSLAYGFQQQVIKSHKEQITRPQETAPGVTIHLHDRHLISALPFASLQFFNKFISASEYKSLKGQIRAILNNNPAQIPTTIFYLEAPLHLIQSRIRARAREGEAAIEPSYLQKLADFQRHWLKKLNRAYGIKVISITISQEDSPQFIGERICQELSPNDTIKFTKLHPQARAPCRASADAAGYDLFSTERLTIPARGRAHVPTGIAIALPAGTYGRIAARSGTAFRSGICVGAGVIDRDYRGSIGALLFNCSAEDFEVCPGDRIAQLICERNSTPGVREDSSLQPTERGAQGFGSTGI